VAAVEAVDSSKEAAVMAEATTTPTATSTKCPVSEEGTFDKFGIENRFFLQLAFPVQFLKERRSLLLTSDSI
jgi:hypothetical protein